MGKAFGIFFILFGGVFLLRNFGIIPDVNFDFVWPLLFIALGVHILFKRNGHWCGMGCHIGTHKQEGE